MLKEKVQCLQQRKQNQVKEAEEAKVKEIEAGGIGSSFGSWGWQRIGCEVLERMTYNWWKTLVRTKPLLISTYLYHPLLCLQHPDKCRL